MRALRFSKKRRDRNSVAAFFIEEEENENRLLLRLSYYPDNRAVTFLTP
jgi:hypothetical protein